MIPADTAVLVAIEPRSLASPMAMPNALASLLLAIAQPSLLLSTITGRLLRLGRKTRSQET